MIGAITAPVRLQLSRKKGFDLQALSHETNGLPAVNVARPGPWGNPFVIDKIAPGPRGLDGMRVRDAAHAVELFREFTQDFLATNYANWRGGALRIEPDLRGKNLACWCKPGTPCHADILLELANRPICEAVP